MHCGTDPVVTDKALILRQSNCHLDGLPNVARGMTWHDPFYDEGNDHCCVNSEIIAAFDIDRTLYDRSTFDIFNCLYCIPVYCILFLPIWFVSGTDGYIFIVYCLGGFYALLVYLVADCYRRERKVRIKRIHVAISTCGIYIDEVDAPGSNSLACRNRIPYHEIKECRIVSWYDHLFQTMRYKLCVITKSHVELVIEGISNQHKFVEIVNAMMEWERQNHICCPKCASVDTTAIESDGVLGYDIMQH